MYVVIAPAKTFAGIEDVVSLATDDMSAAQKAARQIAKKFEDKGYQSWAKRVKIYLPKTPQALIETAEKIEKRASELDIVSNGNSFFAQELFNKAKTLRVRADELVDPESYAD